MSVRSRSCSSCVSTQTCPISRCNFRQFDVTLSSVTQLIIVDDQCGTKTPPKTPLAVVCTSPAEIIAAYANIMATVVFAHAQLQFLSPVFSTNPCRNYVGPNSDSRKLIYNFMYNRIATNSA